MPFHAYTSNNFGRVKRMLLALMRIVFINVTQEKCSNREFDHNLIFVYFNRFKIDLFNFHSFIANISSKWNFSTKWNAQ